ncbi:MAG: hypothetical protein JNL87_13495 [Burkholderiaceae bacterium]|nr:hypothetical protein [Burkholderiaceae bacterium]
MKLNFTSSWHCVDFVAFIIDTMTLGKIRKIAVLKLVGTRNRSIAWIGHRRLRPRA